MIVSKSLSVKQPWSELIISGRKEIEIRSWATNYRGRIAIHAGLNPDFNAMNRFELKDGYLGGIIGTIDLLSIVPFDESRWASWKRKHLDNGIYKDGLYAWILANPKRLSQPLKSSGKIGLYDLDKSLVNDLNHLL